MDASNLNSCWFEADVWVLTGSTVWVADFICPGDPRPFGLRKRWDGGWAELCHLLTPIDRQRQVRLMAVVA